MNKVILLGNLTRDPEVKYTQKGSAVANITLCANRTWRTESGEKKEEATFVDVAFFGKTAETVGKYVAKGGEICIEGRLKLDQWEDKQSGQKRQKLSVVAESFWFTRGSGAKREQQDPKKLDSSDYPGTPRQATDDIPF